MRLSCRAAILTAAAAACLALGAPPALAGTLSYDGNTLVFTGGDNLNHEVQFRYNQSTNSDEILDTQPITGAPGDCSYVVDPTWVSCPGHNEMRAELGAGNDSVTTRDDCFDVYTINLGDGTNSNELGSTCPAGETATITSGSGQDELRGGSENTTFFAGGGDDHVNGGDGVDVIHGGEGADELDGYGGNDEMYGEGGPDTIRGHAGNDIEDGGPGDDKIGYSGGLYNDDDQGADDVRGGTGADQLTLDAHTGGMTINLDDVANDGSDGEGDNIHSDIEKIYGTKANDTYTGSGNADYFDGDVGADTIHGGGGGDTLYGGSENDKVYGDAGNDTVYGDYGDDLVDGGSGTDSVYGDLASCSSFSCPAGNDQLFTRDGELDQANCGAGADTLQADQLDVYATDGFQACESVDRATVAVVGGSGGGGGSGSGSGAGGAGAGGAAAALGVNVPGSIKVKALLKKGLPVTLACPGACTIAAELRYKSKKLGSAHKTLLKSGPAKLVVKVAKKAKGTVRRLKRGTLTLRLKVTDAAGKATSVTRTVKLKR